MRNVLVALFLIGCGAVEVSPSVDAGADLVTAYVTNAGAACIPSDDDFNGQQGGSDCPCVPPLQVPPSTASAGAYCQPTEHRCCAWYVVAPMPLQRWENCGEGWTCTGDRCP